MTHCTDGVRFVVEAKFHPIHVGVGMVCGTPKLKILPAKRLAGKSISKVTYFVDWHKKVVNQSSVKIWVDSPTGFRSYGV